MLLARRISIRPPYFAFARHASSSTTTRQASDILSKLGLDTSKELSGLYDGQWKASGELVESRNPATGQVLGRIITPTTTEVRALISSSRSSYLTWRSVPSPRRGDIVRQIGVALRARSHDLGALVSLEMGKILPEGVGEVQEFVDICEYATGLSRMMEGRVVGSERERHFMMERPNPLGVLGVISAFNFPVAVYGWNLALSLICGNSTIWKPAPTTSLCAIATTRIVADVLEANGLPGSLAGLACGGREAGVEVVANEEVDMVSFTGSEKAGLEAAKVVQARSGKVLLELGGNNAAIVLPSANLPLALRTILFGAIGTAGQRCTTTRRLLLHESIADSFLSSLKDAYAKVRIGDPLHPSTLCGPLHSPSALEGFKAAVARASQEGGEVVCGGEEHVFGASEEEGERLSGGNWVKPTLVWWGEGREMAKKTIVKEETFAPLLHVGTFKTLEEAVEINNGVRQGLSSTLFTRDMADVFKWTGPEGSDCGIVNVNQSTSGAEAGGTAFGGNKATGWGRESGGDAWKQYVRWSSSIVNFGDDLPLAQGIKFGDD